MMMSTFVCSPDKVGEADSMFLTQTETCSWLEEFDSEYQFNAPENNLNFEQPETPTSLPDDDLSDINIHELLNFASQLCDFEMMDTSTSFPQSILHYQNAPRSPDELFVDLDGMGTFAESSPESSFCDENYFSCDAQNSNYESSEEISAYSEEATARHTSKSKSKRSKKLQTETPSSVKRTREGRRSGCKNNTKAPNIAHWTAQQVCDSSLDHVIAWKSKRDGTFIIRDQKRLAELWGEKKNKPMDFASYSRALRYHYTKSVHCELVPIPKKLIYKFSEDFMKKIASNWMKLS